MSYQLVLTEAEKMKAVGDNVFLDKLPLDYRVYIFFYPGINADKKIIELITQFGEITGKNCFVNVAKLDDPSYNKIRRLFDISVFPTIILTALNNLASPQGENNTSFVRIDSKALFKSPETTLTTIEKIYNLFIDGKIIQALEIKKRDERVNQITAILHSTLKELKGFIKEWDVSFSFITGTLELKPRDAPA